MTSTRGSARQNPLVRLGPWEQLRAGRLRRRIPQLLVGLAGYGAAIMTLVRSGLGSASWNVLTEGIAHRLQCSFGTATNAIALVVLAAWIPLRERPGLGTVLNVGLVGLASDVTAVLLPPAHGLVQQSAYLAVGLVALPVFDALYLGAQLGPGPRDGIMTGLTRRTGWPVRYVRTAIEVIVATTGWLLGGTLGIGTVLVAVTLGPILGWVLPRVAVRLDGASCHPDPRVVR